MDTTQQAEPCRAGAPQMLFQSIELDVATSLRSLHQRKVKFMPTKPTTVAAAPSSMTTRYLCTTVISNSQQPPHLFSWSCATLALLFLHYAVHYQGCHGSSLQSGSLVSRQMHM